MARSQVWARTLVGMTGAFDDMDLRDLVDLLSDDEKKELRPAVMRVLERLPSQEVLRRDLNRRLLNV
ncbi:hypothetical protein FNL39_1011130 [Nocardia caishijiensis]|uniref:Uncharacterized protein n=3 Tax=Nocardia TaxID=1817 RepID=A0A4R6P3L6_NOCIG|nr:hypothetical protein FNL39_1011130 [Nocardia caishijiensis]TDP32374.1 hypothetical protein DFR75_106165 [Nocardia ignorata]